jgi:hypothetical protein
MSGPWEQFAPQAATEPAPWEQFKTKSKAEQSSGDREPREVTAIREQFRSQGPLKIASGNLMGLTDEINSAGAAGIDRLVGRTDDWNERRKAYRAAFKQERQAAEHQLGGVGTFAADFAGGMAAAPFKLANGTGQMVSALPLPAWGAMKAPLPPAANIAGAIARPFAETARNLPTLAKTGALYGGLGGFIASPEDEASARTVNAGYGAVGGAAVMPGIHFGANALASAGQGTAGTARSGFEKLTGTTPAQRAVMEAKRQELLAAGMRESEVYGPFLRPEGEGWAAKGIANSAAGHQVSKRAADRHVAGLERELGQTLDATGAPRSRFTAAQERQAFLDRQVNQYSLPRARVQYADDADLWRWSDPLTQGLPRPSPAGPAGPGNGGGPRDGGGGGGAGMGPGGPVNPRPQPGPRGPALLQRYDETQRVRFEGKLPHPENYYTNDEAATLSEMWRFSRERIKKPQGLTDWIIKNGGIKDPFGDIEAMIGKANMRPGLINNKSGRNPDDLTRHAWETGYIESQSRPTINQLYDHLHSDLSGQPVVRASEQALLDDLLAQQQIAEELGRHGLTAKTERELRRQLLQPQPRITRNTAEQPAPEPVAEQAPAFLAPKIPEAPGGRNPLDVGNAATGPTAESAPKFLRRPQPTEMMYQRPGSNLPAPPRQDVGRSRSIDGEALPPQPPEPPAGLPPPAEPGPRPPGYDPALTDKDRIAAMYELSNRQVPGQGKGGMGTAKLPHAVDQDLLSVVEDIRRTARAQRRLPGDDPSKSIWDSPASTEIEKEVRRHLPADLATSLFSRDINNPAPRQMVEYRTMVRDADTSNPMTRTTTQTWLPRAEQALTGDIERRLGALKDDGVALAHWKNSNRQYTGYKEDHAAPLRSIIGEKVRPEQAFDKLSAAMKGKDLGLVRAYAGAHTRAGDELGGAGAAVAHLMEGGIGNFVKEFSSYTAPAKAALFVGQAKPLGAALETYSKLAAPALEARNAMTWYRGGVHNLSVGTAFVLHNMTSAITLALGQYGAARFIASPRYVTWMTRASPVVARSPSAWQGQLETLGLIAAKDKSELGRSIVKYLSDAEKKQRLLNVKLNTPPEASP